MSSNLTPSLPSGNHRSAVAHAVDGLPGVSPAATLNARGQSESDSQAFARWMAQYSQSEPVRQAPSAPVAALPPKALQPGPASHLGELTGGKLAAPDVHADAPAKPQAQAQPRPGAKALTKPANAKAPEAPRPEAKADKAEGTDKGKKADPADESEGASLSDGQPVAFATAQGEATAYVKELQPPAHVPAGDPAAMLAWLSTLAQAKGGAQADAVELDASATTASGGRVSSGGGDPGVRLSQPSWAVQGALSEAASGGQKAGEDGAKQGEGQREGEREGALSLEGLGMSSTQDKAPLSDTTSFGAFMSQALTRAPDGLTRQDSAHQTDTLPTPLNSPDFAQALSDKVGLWVHGAAQEGPMTAELRLNPAEMGPVHIRIELDGQTANIDFAAQALETRQAIEASLPMLSEALAQAGLSLSGGGVSDQPQQQPWSQAQSQAAGGQGGDGRARVPGPGGLNPEGLLDAQTPARLPRGRAGGLDLYA